MQEDDLTVVDKYKPDGVNEADFDLGVPIMMPLLGDRNYQIMELQLDFDAPEETAMKVSQP